MAEPWYRRRWEVLLRDVFTCQYCGQSAPNVTLEVDHKTERSLGGTDDLSNLAAACRACNIGKESYRAFGKGRAVRVPRLTVLDKVQAFVRQEGASCTVAVAKATGLDMAAASRALHSVIFEVSHKTGREVYYKLKEPK